jgi:hypothetical protein
MFPTARFNSSKQKSEEVPKEISDFKKELNRSPPKKSDSKRFDELEMRLMMLEAKLEKGTIPEHIKISLEYILQCNYTRAKPWPALMAHLKIIADHFGLSLIG